MLLFFIPPLMSLLDYGTLVRTEGWRIMLVIGFSTLMVMVVTAFTVEMVCRLRDGSEGKA
jgi:holin-like protein